VRWRVHITCLALFVVLLASTWPLQDVISTLRVREKLAIPGQDPAEIVPILVLGGFRGVAVDMLWIRAMARQQDRQFYELLTIFDVISKLQPNFPTVWIFQGWNMAYNIAVEWEAKEDKWKWIRKGLAFTERGFLRNPQSGDLCFDLGYMYFHKFYRVIFHNADYYRRMLKKERGVDNYEEALKWMRRALDHRTLHMRAREVIERSICHVLRRASERVEKEGDDKKALQYARESFKAWMAYLKEYPEDPYRHADHNIDYMAKRIWYLEDKIAKALEGE